jgi:hypothetical protein
MALAPYFDKSALAASHALRSFDYAAFLEKLTNSPVGVEFDRSVEDSTEARTTLELLINLLARQYPTLAIECYSSPSIRFKQKLVALAQAINPAIDILDTSEHCSAVVSIGRTSHPRSCKGPRIFVGSDGWLTTISLTEPRRSGNSDQPFGAAAAACIAAANVFRSVFRDSLDSPELDENLVLSLLSLGAPEQRNDVLGAVDLGEAFLAGVGAIGNAAVWTLARVGTLRGTLHLVDHEAIELTNVQRYVLSTPALVGKPKVEIAAEELKSSSLVSRKAAMKWGHFAKARKDYLLPRVAVALDTAEDRRAIQASLPRWIVNSWTQPLDIGVSRHSFASEHACLCCLYLPIVGRKNRDEVVAEALGIPHLTLQVRDLLYRGRVTTEDLLRAIAAGLNIRVEDIQQFEGKPLIELYTQGVCGGVLLRLQSASGRSSAEVPMPFQSALAGVLLASELVAHAAGLKTSPPPVTTRLNLLRPITNPQDMAEKKDPRGICICQDRDYIAQYQAKYHQ